MIMLKLILLEAVNKCW